MRTLDFRYLLLILSLLGMNPVLAASSSLPIAPFEARYTVYAWGLPVGESLLTLTEIDVGRYRMHAEIYAIGVATLLLSEPINVQVEGDWRDDMLAPVHYHYQRGSERNSAALRFDWQHATILARDNDEQATLPLSKRIVDPLSLQLLAMWDLQQGRRPDQYTTVIDTELKTYQVKLEGEETLSTALGELPVLRFSSQKPGGKRVTTLWFAPSLNYLLVQAVQTKKGKEKFKITIDHVTGIGAN